MNGKMLLSHFTEMLAGGAAHVSFEAALAGFPAALAGERVPGIDHSMWMLVEHLRLVNQDLIDWVEAETYSEKTYPSGYWPASAAPAGSRDWEHSVSAVGEGLGRMAEWIGAGVSSLTSPLGRNPSHSASREILLAIAHNGYHIGQIVDLRALLGVPVRDW